MYSITNPVIYICTELYYTCIWCQQLKYNSKTFISILVHGTSSLLHVLSAQRKSVELTTTVYLGKWRTNHLHNFSFAVLDLQQKYLYIHSTRTIHFRTYNGQHAQSLIILLLLIKCETIYMYIYTYSMCGRVHFIELFRVLLYFLS